MSDNPDVDSQTELPTPPAVEVPVCETTGPEGRHRELKLHLEATIVRNKAFATENASLRTRLAKAEALLQIVYDAQLVLRGVVVEPECFENNGQKWARERQRENYWKED